MPTASATHARIPSPLTLLCRVNATQIWRRLKSVRDQSRLLTALIVCFIVGYLVLSFWLFYMGLNFVAKFPGLGIVLTERLLYLLFAFLFVLLLLSNLIISYTNLFRNREAGYLMSLPLPVQTIFRWKFIESTVLASWAFVFLIAPLLAAFGLVRNVPWHFYPVTLVLIGLFIVLPGVAGSWLSLNLARYLDRRAFQITALLMAFGFIVLAAFWWKAQPTTDEMLETRVLAVLDQLLQKTQFAQFPFLPSYWLSSGVLQWADGILNLAGFFVLVLLSNVLFFGFLAFTKLGNFYYDAASRVQSRASVWGQWEWFRASARRVKQFSYPVGPAEKIVNFLLGWLARDTRALLVKDIRMFWRDTAQWGQSVLLFGLVSVYVINLRHFTREITSPYWVHAVSYLNLFTCSLNLVTFTTRFVFPQFSLEGRRLWIVGMAPMGLPRVAIIKCMLASCASLVVTLSLVVLSSCLLNMGLDRVLFFGAVISVMTFTLNGLAAGLGVLYPNFKETNPSKIVSGFGGTFCLVMSFLYIVASLFILIVGSAELANEGRLQLSALVSIVCFLVLSFILGWLPLKYGLRRLKHFEF